MRTKEIEIIENIRDKLRTRLEDKEGEWKTIKGTHVLIDPDGQITKGPDRLKSLSNKKPVSGNEANKAAETGKSTQTLRDELQPQVPDADFSLEDDEEDFVRKNAGNGRRPTGVYNLYNSIKGSGGEAMLAVEDEYYKHRLNACTKDLKEITRKEADEILYDNLRQSTVDGWFRAYNHEYKPGHVWQMTRSPEVHNAALNVMYDNYKWYCKDRNLEPPSYEEFLVTPIKMYRGGSGKEYKKAAVFSSYTFDKKVAESFTGSQVGMGHAYDPNGVVYEAEIRPIDTYGSVFHNGESEILVPRVIAPNKNRDEAE
ncbi:MAG: hypothetical protein IJM76_05885 [Lachnospiraceae bacterium]|nr:hypothetical protein [Lachnospiraceae bacterium]